MKKWLLLVALTLSTQSFAGIDDKNFGTLDVLEITSIYDGDTFRVNIANVHPLIGERMSIRVNGVDTPEIRGKCEMEKKLARIAKQYTVEFLRSASKVELRNVSRGKYFRIVADVYADGKSLTEGLIRNGHATPYDGGRKNKDWCI